VQFRQIPTSANEQPDESPLAIAPRTDSQANMTEKLRLLGGLYLMPNIAMPKTAMPMSAMHNIAMRNLTEHNLAMHNTATPDTATSNNTERHEVHAAYIAHDNIAIVLDPVFILLWPQDLYNMTCSPDLTLASTPRSASWRRMQLTSPPISSIGISVWVTGGKTRGHAADS
jgi:hypothetical protein